MANIKRNDILSALNNIVEMHNAFLKISYSLSVDLFSEDYVEYDSDLKEKCIEFRESILQVGDILNKLNTDRNIIIEEDKEDKFDEVPF